MATAYGATAWKNPGSVVQRNYEMPYGYCNWESINRVKAKDGSGAKPSGSDGVNTSRKTNYLVAYNYGLNVPSGATVIGIEVRINRRKSTNSGSVKDRFVYLREGHIDSKGLVSVNRAKGNLWSKSYVEPVYGSMWDYWGANLTPTRVNAYYFGVMFQAIGASSTYASLNVDSIQMRAHYAYVTDTVTPPVINPDEGTVTIPTDSEDIGVNLIPYETSSPSMDTKDGIVQGGANFSTFSNSKYGVATDSSGRKVYFLNGNGDNYQTRIILYYDIQQLKDNYSLATYRFPVTANQQYTFQFKIKAPVGKRVHGTIEWFNSSYTWITSHGTNSPTSTDANQWMLLQVTATAPSTATHCIFTFGTYAGVGLATSGETVYIKDLQLNTGTFKPYTPSRLHVTAWKRPGTVTQEALGGRANWVNPSNLTSADWATTYANLTSALPNTQGIIGSNWGWNLPEGAVPKGIMSRLMRVGSTTGSTDGWLNIKDVAGMANGSNISGGAVIPTSWQWKTWGGFYNQHGLPSMPTRTQINSGFNWIYTVTRSTTDNTVYLEELQMRIFYLLEPAKETFMVQENPFEIYQEDVDVSQAPLTILPTTKELLLEPNPIQLLMQLGYVGLVDLDRGHHYESVSRTNRLLKERAGNAINYSKSGEIDEKRPLKINIPSRSIKTLEGLVDLQSIIPVNTVIDLPDNDPYVHRGYAILHDLKHDRINRARSLCDMELEYVTKDLYHPLKVDYSVRTTPPFNYELLANHEKALLYLENEDLWNIELTHTTDHSNTPTITNVPEGLSIALDVDDRARFIGKDSISGAFKTITKFSYTKPISGYTDFATVLVDANNISTELLAVAISNNTMTITASATGFNKTETISDGTEFTIAIEVDENNTANVQLNVGIGSATRTHTVTGISLGTLKTYRMKIRSANTSGSSTITPILKTIGITNKLFTDDNDELIRNVVCIPLSEKTNYPHDFTRLTSEGTLLCYLNPVREILFHINPVTYFNSSVRLIDQNGTQIISPDMVFSNTDIITLENGLIKAEFNMKDNNVKLYGFKYGWEYITTLSYDNMYHIKPLHISLDSISIKISETIWTLARGKPFITVKHPYDDLNIQSGDFTNYWSDNGVGVGITKDIVTGNEGIILNGLFYCTMFDSSKSIGLQVIRPAIENLSVDKIPKSDETGLGWFNIIPETNETHAQLGIEYMTKSNQEIGLYL